ncbi:MAG: FIST C-terminal domain-containing protein [Micavibrio sp.]
MATASSTQFISAIAAGENWRDTAKKTLEQLEALRTDGFKPNIGFLYITEELSRDADNILGLFKSVTGIELWSGLAAHGICGAGEEIVGRPGISVMIGEVHPDHVRPYAVAPGESFKKMHEHLEPWLNEHDPMLVVIHADPFSEGHLAEAVEEIESTVGGFMLGGLSSSRQRRSIFGKDESEGRVSGFVFTADVPVASCVSQGCIPMGPYHLIKKADDHIVAALDGRRPLDVFTEDMQAMAEKKLGYSAEQFLREGKIPDDVMTMIKGEAQAAFPVPGSDQQDFLVRSILGMDPESGMIAVAELIEDGQRMMFVHRDDETARSDLAANLVALRKRAMKDGGVFAPKAALYISCVARVHVSFSGDGEAGGEMALIRDVLGDIPVAGFYAGGEIAGGRIYGYTGILALFL